MARTFASFKAAEIKGKIQLSIIKKSNGEVLGFSLHGPIGDDDYIINFFSSLPKRLSINWVKIFIVSSLKHLVVYDPKFIGETMIKFPLHDIKEAQQLKNIMEQRKYKFSVYKPKNQELLGCRLQVV